MKITLKRLMPLYRPCTILCNNVHVVEEFKKSSIFFLFFVFLGIRNKEREHLMKGAFLQGLNIAMALIVPTIATVATFSVHVATGKNLTTSQVINKYLIINLHD